MMRFGPPKGKPSAEAALANPRTAAILVAVRALGEACARRVMEEVRASMRTSISETAEKLAHLKRAGLLRVRRSNLCSSDPYEYNLYSAVSEDDRGAAPRAEEGPHGEGAVGAVGPGYGVDIIKGLGH